MRKPRRPAAFRDLGFQNYEFQLIGEIIVLCGLIEELLRQLPLYLTNSDHRAAIAFTAHLNFLSLCDLNCAIIDECVTDKRERDFLTETVRRANKLFDDRNRIVHGPFQQSEDKKRSTLRTTARRKIRFQTHEFDRTALTTLLSELIETYETLELESLTQKLEWFRRVWGSD